MAGIIGIYGLVVSVLISDNLQQQLPLYTSFIQLGAGLSVGLAGLAAGYGSLYFITTISTPLTSSLIHPPTLVQLKKNFCYENHPSTNTSSTLSFAIGIVGDAGVRGTAQQPRLFVGMILILIFAEVLGLYGLIVALLMNSKATTDVKCNPGS